MIPKTAKDKFLADSALATQFREIMASKLMQHALDAAFQQSALDCTNWDQLNGCKIFRHVFSTLGDMPEKPAPRHSANLPELPRE